MNINFEKMNINFEAAIRHINMGNYDTAIKELKTAIESEEKNGSKSAAIQYRCVLGELLHELDRDDESSVELKTVVEYCHKTNSLPKQENIALDILGAIGGSVTLTSTPIENLRNTPKKKHNKK